MLHHKISRKNIPEVHTDELFGTVQYHFTVLGEVVHYSLRFWPKEGNTKRTHKTFSTELFGVMKITNAHGTSALPSSKERAGKRACKDNCA